MPEPIDLLHLGRPHVIAAWRVGDVIVDPGPSSCLRTLLGSLRGAPPRALALTHIHLDHAGAAGSLCERFRNLEVWVHERGAPHLLDPSRLVESATRLYGGEMERLWGEVLPVPESRLRVLAGGEAIGEFAVAYTPGHASHHVAYLHTASGTAFTGDVAGVRIDGARTLAPTPPPDIDLEAWRESLAAIESWRPRRLAVTHFGAYDDVAEQLKEMRDALDLAVAFARGADERAFTERTREAIAASAARGTAEAYEQAMPPALSFRGVARYLEKAQSAERATHRDAIITDPPSAQPR
jgi:glyoxylase-like metal-dependent hydrolase (beta-lactamase superfamily II)